IAKAIHVAERSVERWVANWKKGQLEEEQGTRRRVRTITDEISRSIKGKVEAEPGIMLDEIQSFIRATHHTELALSSICSFLHRSGYTYKKISCIARRVQRNRY
ncbi:hypothetical protein ADUPG1_005779, partial [Aduncisulcus paluster]